MPRQFPPLAALVGNGKLENVSSSALTTPEYSTGRFAVNVAVLVSLQGLKRRPVDTTSLGHLRDCKALKDIVENDTKKLHS